LNEVKKVLCGCRHDSCPGVVLLITGVVDEWRQDFEQTIKLKYLWISNRMLLFFLDQQAPKSSTTFDDLRDSWEVAR
jgi:hypothetical protein